LSVVGMALAREAAPERRPCGQRFTKVRRWRYVGSVPTAGLGKSAALSPFNRCEADTTCRAGLPEVRAGMPLMRYMNPERPDNGPFLIGPTHATLSLYVRPACRATAKSAGFAIGGFRPAEMQRAATSDETRRGPVAPGYSFSESRGSSAPALTHRSLLAVPTNQSQHAADGQQGHRGGLRNVGGPGHVVNVDPAQLRAAAVHEDRGRLLRDVGDQDEAMG
jgi:hypothetical protein